MPNERHFPARRHYSIHQESLREVFLNAPIDLVLDMSGKSRDIRYTGSEHHVSISRISYKGSRKLIFRFNVFRAGTHYKFCSRCIEPINN